MASTLKSVVGVVISNARTIIYSAPSVGITSSIIFNGGVANLDATNKLTYTVTIEILRGGVYGVRDKDLPVPYGSTLPTGKMALLPGDVVYMTSNVAGMLAGTLDIAERN